MLSCPTDWDKMEEWDYLSISAEFAAKIPFWCEMEEYITDAITRNAFLIGKSVSAFWENNQNHGKTDKPPQFLHS